MRPVIDGDNVRARCPDCDGAVTTFEARKMGHSHDAVMVINNHPQIDGQPYVSTIYRGLRCAGCGRGAMVVFAQKNDQKALIDFYPRSIATLAIPSAVPDDVKAELREAELTGSIGAWRAGSAMLRSTLEKTLKSNGYTRGNLASKIDEAAADGVITEARARRAHDDIRVLGNDVLHDEWRPVGQDEFDLAHRYTQRILEDLYDDRTSVESLLTAKNRLPRI